jgi:hypothetical protein
MKLSNSKKIYQLNYNKMILDLFKKKPTQEQREIDQIIKANRYTILVLIIVLLVMGCNDFIYTFFNSIKILKG